MAVAAERAILEFLTNTTEKPTLQVSLTQFPHQQVDSANGKRLFCQLKFDDSDWQQRSHLVLCMFNCKFCDWLKSNRSRTRTQTSRKYENHGTLCKNLTKKLSNRIGFCILDKLGSHLLLLQYHHSSCFDWKWRRFRIQLFQKK